MSFSHEQKLETIKQFAAKPQCCRRALLEGLLASSSVISDSNVILSFGSEEVAILAEELVMEAYSKEALRVSSPRGGRRRLVSFRSNAAIKYLHGIDSTGIAHFEKCADCSAAFLSGVFLGAGRIIDPTKRFDLEFSLSGRTEMFRKYFVDLGLNMKLSRKSNECVLYLKKSDEIEDFFALAGMNHTAFELMNAKIEREIRNNANRVSNCETNNIDKAVKASVEQIAVIKKLISTGLISYLPDELEMTARLRMENEHLSLAQLASIITPPISKPGLSHRLKKINQLAEELLNNSKNK